MKPSIVALLGVVLAAAPAAAQPRAGKPAKVVKACGVTVLPLSVGNEWVYEPIAPPPDRVLTDAQLRGTPVQPKKVTIKVTNIETAPDGTTVTLSEDLDGKVHNTTIRCTAAGQFQVSPLAFWFAGEPGITHGLELTDVVRKGNTLNLALGKITGVEWYDDLEAKWKHVPVAKAAPKMRSGTLHIKRHWVLQPEEKLTAKDGTEIKTTKLGLETTVTTTIEPPTEQPLKPPVLLVNFFWYVDGIGPIQILNSYSQQFLLTSSTIAK